MFYLIQKKKKKRGMSAIVIPAGQFLSEYSQIKMHIPWLLIQNKPFADKIFANGNAARNIEYVPDDCQREDVMFSVDILSYRV